MAVVGRRVKWERGMDALLSDIERIREELDKMEWYIKHKEEFERSHPSNCAGLEMGLCMDSIIMALNRIFEYYIEENGEKRTLTLDEYLRLTR